MSPEEIERTKQFILEKRAQTEEVLKRIDPKLNQALPEIERLKRRMNRPARKDVRLEWALAEIERLKRRMARPLTQTRTTSKHLKTQRTRRGKSR